jgi:hypothetical protein
MTPNNYLVIDWKESVRLKHWGGFPLFTSCLEKLSDNSPRAIKQRSYTLANEQKQPIPEAGDVQIYGLAPLWLIYRIVSRACQLVE